MLARLGFGKLAFALSLVAHAGLALVATERARHAFDSATRLAPPVTDLATPELLPVDAQTEPALGTAADEDPKPSRVRAAVREQAASATVPTSFKSTTVPEPETGTTTDVEPVKAPSGTAKVEASVPRFTLLVAPTQAAVAGTSALSEQAGLSGSSGTAPLSESAVDTPAKLRSGTPPAYTAQALSAGIEQDVRLELVIDPSGAVLSARALEHVGYGLDEAALRSVQSYRFTPARRSGRPVAVRMRWVMRFQLQ